MFRIAYTLHVSYPKVHSPKSIHANKPVSIDGIVVALHIHAAINDEG